MSEAPVELPGLMQDDFPLTLGHILRRMRSYNHGAEVVSVGATGEVERIGHAALAARVDRLARALERLGVRPGDRVATFAWNHQRHFELYLAIPCSGAVLHTLNPRLHPDELSFIVNDAEDRAIVVDESMTNWL